MLLGCSQAEKLAEGLYTCQYTLTHANNMCVGYGYHSNTASGVKVWAMDELAENESGV